MKYNNYYRTSYFASHIKFNINSNNITSTPVHGGQIMDIKTIKRFNINKDTIETHNLSI